MEPLTVVLIGLALIVCAYMAWNIGANDVANAMGTSVGSRALTLKQAVIIAAVFEFAGAFFAGDAVTDTVRKGILSVDFADPMIDEVFSTDIALGFIAAMMAAATWLTIATRYGLPVRALYCSARPRTKNVGKASIGASHIERSTGLSLSRMSFLMIINEKKPIKPPINGLATHDMTTLRTTSQSMRLVEYFTSRISPTPRIPPMMEWVVDTGRP